MNVSCAANHCWLTVNHNAHLCGGQSSVRSGCQTNQPVPTGRQSDLLRPGIQGLSDKYLSEVSNQMIMALWRHLHYWLVSREIARLASSQQIRVRITKLTLKFCARHPIKEHWRAENNWIWEVKTLNPDHFDRCVRFESRDLVCNWDLLNRGPSFESPPGDFIHPNSLSWCGFKIGDYRSSFKCLFAQPSPQTYPLLV